MSSFYWLGRLGAFDERQAGDMMVDESLKMTEADIKLELQRCGVEMQSRGGALQRIGKSMRDRAARSDTH